MLWHEHFVVDVLQGGAGTSTNTNTDEVIANRALEILGSAPGDHALLSPDGHVDLGQSTNDAHPAAVKIALHEAAHTLAPATDRLAAALPRPRRSHPEHRGVHRALARPQALRAPPGQALQRPAPAVLRPPGRLQLNAFAPLIAHRLLTAQRRLAAACALLATACVEGIRAERCTDDASSVERLL